MQFAGARSRSPNEHAQGAAARSGPIATGRRGERMAPRSPTSSQRVAGGADRREIDSADSPRVVDFSGPKRRARLLGAEPRSSDARRAGGPGRCSEAKSTGAARPKGGPNCAEFEGAANTWSRSLYPDVQEERNRRPSLHVVATRFNSTRTKRGATTKE